MDFVFVKVTEADVFMTSREPYRHIKSIDAVEKESARKDIESLVRQLAHIADELIPVMPHTAEAIRAAVRENKKPENLFPRL